MFPDPEQANANGLVAVGGDLSAATLEEAYTSGIFPWPQQDYPLLWFSPPERGILRFQDFKIPNSTQRKIKQETFKLTMNQAFMQVIENCARIPRHHENRTWILPEMVQAYSELHRLGHGISVEAWFEDHLVGGLYGVLFKGVFSGESMFFKKSEASKVCLVHLVEELRQQGHTWIDIQMVTPLLEQFGGVYVPRSQFLKMLKQRQKDN